MATQVIAEPRFQAAAKKLPVAESKILGEFLRLVLLTGVNPESAASTAHAHSHPLEAADKDLAFGGTAQLVLPHNRIFYKYSGPRVTLTNVVPITHPQ